MVTTHSFRGNQRDYVEEAESYAVPLGLSHTGDQRCLIHQRLIGQGAEVLLEKQAYCPSIGVMMMPTSRSCGSTQKLVAAAPLQP